MYRVADASISYRRLTTFKLMKQFAFLLWITVLGQYSYCQQSYGFKAGVNYSDQLKKAIIPQSPGHTIEAKPLLGYQLGLFYKIKLNAAWAFSGEANFSLVGSRNPYITEQQLFNPDGTTYYYKDKIGYITVPLTVQYNFDKFYLGAGPGIALKVFSKITNFENRSAKTNSYQMLDVAGIILSGYKLSRSFDVNASYSYGLLNIYNGTGNYLETMNRGLNLSILYHLIR